MTSAQLHVALAATAATLVAVAVPLPVVLVGAGLVIGLVPFVPDFSLDPHLVLLGLLLPRPGSRPSRGSDAKIPSP